MKFSGVLYGTQTFFVVEKISLSPKLCEICNYFTETIFKLSPTYHRRSKCNCIIHIVVTELVANLNISENKPVVRDIQIVYTGRSENDQLFNINTNQNSCLS